MQVITLRYKLKEPVSYYSFFHYFRKRFIMKKIIITGATGLIGEKLCRELSARGDELTIFTRNVENAKKSLPFINNFIEWDYKNPAHWQSYIEDSDAIIHLAGANLFGKRWDDNYKKKIIESREISTRNLVEAIKKTDKKPQAFICASAVGIYGNCGDEILTENSLPGNDFLSQVCKTWEDEAKNVEKYSVRRVSVRTGIVLSPDDGALKQMLLPFRLFVGGPLGTGKQWFPWIHIDDLVNIFIKVLDDNSFNGPVNAVAPNPVTMNEFSKTLGNVLHRPSFFKVPEFALKFVVGEGAESILASLRVIPEKLMQSKFNFKFEKLKPALENVLNKR